MIRWIGLWIKYFIEKKEFFIYPHKQAQNIFDIILHKQFWFSHFFIHFIESDFVNYSLDAQKSIIYNSYKEIKMKNNFQKIFIYPIIFLENENTASMEELFMWIKKEKLPIHMISINMSSLKSFSIFSNFKDSQNILSFINEYIHHVYYDPTNEINILDIEENTKKENGYYLKNKSFYLYTGIILINVLYYIYMSIHGETTYIYDLIQFGAKYNPLIAYGQYYRLFTNMFIHIGITHLIVNNISLYSLGKDLESIYGFLKFFIIYIISGLMGSLCSFVFSNAVSAGASGAIFGLVGAYIYFGIRKPFVFSTRYGMNLITLLIINIVFGLTSSNIDNFAHIGGFIGGFLTSFAIGLKKDKVFKKENIKFQICLLIIISFLLSFGIYNQKNSLEYYIHTGAYYIKINNLSHAKIICKEGIQKYKNSDELYFYLGYTYYYEGNISQSIFYLQKCLSINPNHKGANEFLKAIKNNMIDTSKI